MYNFGSFDAFIVKPMILPEICSIITQQLSLSLSIYVSRYIKFSVIRFILSLSLS